MVKFERMDDYKNCHSLWGNSVNVLRILTLNKPREAETLLSQGATISVASKRIGVSTHTYYRWRKEYGGVRG